VSTKDEAKARLIGDAKKRAEKSNFEGKAGKKVSCAPVLPPHTLYTTLRTVYSAD
jgi:hypothetical protein